MGFNSLPSENVAVLGAIDPDENAAGTLTSDYGDMSKFGSALALIKTGNFGSGGTLDAKLVQATDSTGTGKKDITGKAITQRSQIGVDGNKQFLINVMAQELDIDNAFTHVAIEMTIGTNPTDSDATLLGFDPYDKPASDNDLDTVDEIVT